MQAVTITQITPPELETLIENSVKRVLDSHNPAKNRGDRWLDLNELCNYLPDKPAKATAYGWVNKDIIPHYKDQKKLRFLKSEIDKWLKSGREKSGDKADVQE